MLSKSLTIWNRGLFVMALTVAAAACGSEQEAEENTPNTNTGKLVKVTYQGASQDIDLSTLTSQDVGGTQVVTVAAVVLKALPDKTVTVINANFVASDGFNPSSRANCEALLPITGDTLNQGYIEPATRNLSWDEALSYPGCLTVRDLAEIVVADQPQ